MGVKTPSEAKNSVYIMATKCDTSISYQCERINTHEAKLSLIVYRLNISIKIVKNLYNKKLNSEITSGQVSTLF